MYNFFTSCLDFKDSISVSALVCMVTYWIGPKVNHNIKLLIVMIHQTTILYGLLTLIGY